MKTKLSAVLLLILIFPGVAISKRTHLEKEYQESWCKQRGGIVEYLLPDKTRVDCLLSDHAIEFDFANKWAESIGQALYYAGQTDKLPGVVLILEDPKDSRFLKRLRKATQGLNFRIWTTGKGAPTYLCDLW